MVVVVVVGGVTQADTTCRQTPATTQALAICRSSSALRPLHSSSSPCVYTGDAGLRQRLDAKSAQALIDYLARKADPGPAHTIANMASVRIGELLGPDEEREGWAGPKSVSHG